MAGKRSAAGTIDEYIRNLPEPRREPMRKLHELIRATVPELEPTMEFGMPGYGRYHYRYASGREGDWVLVSMASNKASMSLYVTVGDEKGYLPEQYADRLPKASIGKSCIRFKRLDDLPRGEIRKLLKHAAREAGKQGLR